MQRTAARWTCRRWQNTSSVGDMLGDLKWPSMETHREQFSLTFFHKIYCSIVYIDKEKYFTPAPVSERLGHLRLKTQNIVGILYIMIPKIVFPRNVSYWSSLPSPASILYKSIAGRYRPVSYPDAPITARYRFIKYAYWVFCGLPSPASILYKSIAGRYRPVRVADGPL